MSGDRYMPPFRADMPLAEARELLVPLAEHGGTTCPCCTQTVRVYRRKLTSVPARALAGLYIDHGLEYGHLPTVAGRHLPGQAHQGGYLALAAHWGLMVDERHRRRDGGRAGLWRVTPLGEGWLLGDATVPTYARIYNGRCLAVEGDPVTIDQVVGTGFDLARLLDVSARPATDEHGTPALFDGREAA